MGDAVLGNIRGKGARYRGWVWVTLCSKHQKADLRCHICRCGCWLCETCGQAQCRCITSENR